MRQPIIDPAKVDAWTASVRGVFADNSVGTLLVVGITLAFLLMVVWAAWSEAHKPHKPNF